ncbi:hypothetical protein M8A51_25760 [Schlegelella sp. S2-27]|uniref:Uncharacterized protein n=1 Tax=Caldimonas mangrovi TaxID=2944811 RepID=A0ABT0YW13_9BURK|nr:hypothetical protein [Caldimonas mangrovi]MCM5682944.1 hypothetical protein [Caldimonas mangrovi]
MTDRYAPSSSTGGTMASRRSRQRQTAEEAKWIAWADVSENTQEIDTSDECVDQDDVFDGEQYEDDRRNDR